MNIIDRRRISRDRSTENRSRFLKRYKEAIKRQLPDILNNQSLNKSASGGGKVKVNKKTVREPFFHYDEGGSNDYVLPGNEHYTEGDLMPKPFQPPGRGNGRGPGAGTGKGEDEFDVDLNREEFLDLIFDDCELPNLAKTDLIKLKERKVYHAGFTSDGPPNRLSIVRTYKQSFIRRVPVLAELQEEIDKLLEELNSLTPLEAKRSSQLTQQILKLKEDMENVPLFDDIDLRYRSTVVQEIPKLHATMVLVMDNSGSMGLREKTIARKFFLILYLFLQRNYDEIDLVFISHTTEASELSEEEFFNTHESGGTIVSSALDLVHKIIDERLKGKTNIYVAQVSDGDNDDTDNGTCNELLEDDILPHVRYYAYVQVDEYHERDRDVQGLLSFGKGLWKSYELLMKRHPQFQIKRVSQERDIFPVFKELFSKPKGKR